MNMDFPIIDLLDDELSTEWLLQYFHPDGLKCPHCQSRVEEARTFRQTKTSHLTVYRCNHCEGIDNLYSGTVFEAKHLRPAPVILLLRGVCQGKSTAQMAREIEVSRQTVLAIRRLIQEKGQQLQPQTPLSDLYTETDDMFQNAGEKKRTTSEPSGSTKVSGQQTKGTWYLRERPPADSRYGWQR
jgi:hypothetical protein